MTDSTEGIQIRQMYSRYCCILFGHTGCQYLGTLMSESLDTQSAVVCALEFEGTFCSASAPQTCRLFRSGSTELLFSNQACGIAAASLPEPMRHLQNSKRHRQQEPHHDLDTCRARGLMLETLWLIPQHSPDHLDTQFLKEGPLVCLTKSIF